MSLVLLCEGKTKCFKSDSKTKPRLKTFPTYSYFEIVNYCREKCARNNPDRSTRGHSRRPRGNQSGQEKRRDESFQVRAKEPLGTDSHRTISKNSSGCRLLIGHKKCFVLLCPIGEQFLLSSFREFVHDGYWLDHGLSGSCTKEMHAVRKLSVWYKLSISKYCLPEN